MAVRGVVFDVGNVIVRWSPRTLYEKIFPDSAACDWFLENVCTMDWHMRHDHGVPFEENRRTLVARFPEFEAAIRAWEERWWEMFSGPIAETEAVIEKLHGRGVRMLGLTNMPRATTSGTFALSPAFKRLSDIIVSSEVGLAKPDPAIFALAAERAGLPAPELLFVDDSARNTEAAASAGYRVHLFEDPAALEPAMADLGLL